MGGRGGGGGGGGVRGGAGGGGVVGGGVGAAERAEMACAGCFASSFTEAQDILIP